MNPIYLVVPGILVIGVAVIVAGSISTGKNFSCLADPSHIGLTEEERSFLYDKTIND